MISNEPPEWRGQLNLPTGPEWQILAAMLSTLSHRIYRVDVLVRGGRAVLKGEVFSQQVADSIKHLVALHAPVSGLDSELKWASPLYNADTPDMDVEYDWSAAAKIESTSFETVERSPMIKPLGKAEVGKRLDILVDLVTVIGDDTFGEFAVTLPHGWDVIEVDAVLSSGSIKIPDMDRRRTIRLNSDGSSVPVLFSGVITPEAHRTSSVKIMLALAFEGRDVGYAERTVPLSDNLEVEPSSGAIGTIPVKFDTTAVGPDLTVRIFEIDNNGRYQWSFEVAPKIKNINIDRFGDRDLKESPKNYFLKRFANCPTMKPGQHLGKLQGIGEQIWDMTPPQFRDLYFDVLNQIGPGFSIQIVTNEPYVPWELMFPTDVRSPSPTHLFLAHPVARWLGNSGSRHKEFEQGKRISFVPEYFQDERLDAARDEGEWLINTLGAVPGDASYKGFRDFLHAQHVDRIQLIHFAGHGASEEHQENGLRLNDDDWITLEDINSSVRVGRDHRALFILNACQIGQNQFALGAISGWPQALLKLDFGGVVAPLWAVQDNTASEFMREFLAEFIQKGKTLGQAALEARGLHGEKDTSAYAYMFYGDVMATACN
jgi:hypothetical protein